METNTYYLGLKTIVILHTEIEDWPKGIDWGNIEEFIEPSLEKYGILLEEIWENIDQEEIMSELFFYIDDPGKIAEKLEAASVILDTKIKEYVERERKLDE